MSDLKMRATVERQWDTLRAMLKRYKYVHHYNILLLYRNNVTYV